MKQGETKRSVLLRRSRKNPHYFYAKNVNNIVQTTTSFDSAQGNVKLSKVEVFQSFTKRLADLMF